MAEVEESPPLFNKQLRVPNPTKIINEIIWYCPLSLVSNIFRGLTSTGSLIQKSVAYKIVTYKKVDCI